MLNQNQISLQASRSAQVQHKVFTLSLKRPSREDKSQVQFTIKFRPGEDHAWTWAHSQFSYGDGVLYYQPKFEHHDISYYIEGLSSDIKLETLTADTPNTQLWSLTAPAKAADGDESGYSTHLLGKPKAYSHWFALVRLWAPWLAPRQGKDSFSPDKDAMLASFLRHDGIHVVILGISGIDDVLTLFKHDDAGNVIISGRNDGEGPGISRVLVAVAESFEIANAAVMYQARRIVMTIRDVSVNHEAEQKALKDIKPEWLEEWADGFAYCTWNSLGQNLTEEKIYEALDSFKNIGVQIANLIIDDNWQSLDNAGQEQYVRRMTRFEANSEGFPSGLWQ
jgi:hypothetical protein